MTDERDTVIAEFGELVNMTASELRDWLDTDESRSSGESEGGESKGHASGRKIAALLEKGRSELGDEDLDHMRRVRGYIKRHLAQRPEGDIADTPWRYSLMNWGHDPLK